MKESYEIASLLSSVCLVFQDLHVLPEKMETTKDNFRVAWIPFGPFAPSKGIPPREG